MARRTAKHPHRQPVWIATLIVTTGLAGPAAAQSVSVGADVVSRYVWRGLDFGESMSLQPGLTIGLGGLEVGAWGSYSISASGAGSNENDLWASFTHEFESGASVSFGVTDYYFPNAVVVDEEKRERMVLGFRDPEAHTQEVSVSVSGTESLPVSLFAGLVLDDAVYFEAGMPIKMGDAEVAVHAGAVSGESTFYNTKGFALVNLGVTASAELKLTDSYAPPVSVSYIVNPSDEETGNRAYLVFAVSLVP